MLVLNVDMPKKSFVLKTADLQTRFFLIDCGKHPLTLGRLATAVVRLLKGKDLACYTPNIGGANTKVIIINANKVIVTGDKENQKRYRRHTGYVGGLKETIYKNMKKTDVIEKAIHGMINKGPMRNLLMSRVYVYPTEEHPHNGQKPVPYQVPYQKIAMISEKINKAVDIMEAVDCKGIKI